MFKCDKLNHRSTFTPRKRLVISGGEVWCDCTEQNVEIAGGHYTLTKNLTRGSMLIYQCPEGYYPYPNLLRLCQRGGWSPAPKRFPPQRCRTVECPDPNVLEYGTVIPPQENYYVGNKTTIECYSGYTLRGSAVRDCLPNGKWSGYTPICSRDASTCADPGIPPGASRTGNSFDIDDVVKYTCSAHLFLVGSSERVCQENGQWTGKEPACYYKHTYDTSLEVSQAFGSAIKDTLTTLEPIDDLQEGRKIRISKNGTLNIYIAVDISESIEEHHFIDARNAVLKLITKISSFSVTPNYEILFFSSEIYEVVNIIDFLDHKIELSTVKTKIENFVIGAKNTGTDLNLAFRTFDERMSIIKQRVGEKVFKEHRHVLIIFSDGAYNMGDSPLPTLEKIKNRVYMNQLDSREEYLDVYVFGIGTQVLDADLQALTAGKGGNHYFRMKKLDALQETFDDIIDEEEVMGLCGLHKDYESESISLREARKKRFPWVVFIIVQNEIPRKCLGSLVTPKFVLTAAHCFVFGDKVEHISVEIDTGTDVKIHKVKDFKLHPKYNINAKVNQSVKEFYDYDVALIQLEEYITFSVAIRPICIPCTQETSNALKLVGASTCKQQEELLLNSQLEQLSFLTRAGLLVHEKTVHAKIGDNRDECIKHALKAPGITTKNPRDAVTDNFLCTGGLTPFRDHIACTGDSGGAVFKHFEHRTIQVAVVSWGTKNLCQAGRMMDSEETSRDFHINLFRVVPFLKSILGDDTQDDYAPLQFLES
ncbi:hypothetical protein PAMA_006057 [Pampus argenteus]